MLEVPQKISISKMRKIKNESIANHDVKSVEYWLREKLKKKKK